MRSQNPKLIILKGFQPSSSIFYQLGIEKAGPLLFRCGYASQNIELFKAEDKSPKTITIHPLTPKRLKAFQFNSII